jgi:branched-chain amino acid transport system permease protein
VGPNGAGKSTFFNLCVGRYAPSAGSVRFGERDITRVESYARARLGLGIKLQVPSLYKGLTTFENMWLAAYARLRDCDLATRRAVDALDWLRMLPEARMPAGTLSHGQQQWLEIGMVLVTEPSVLLLDEPTAGMTREETTRTAELVRELGERASVVVVEHDMEFVRQLDVPITLFHRGKIFAQGSLSELQSREEILDIYLGRGG